MVDISKLIKNVSKVKLSGGIFTKASIVIIVITICISSIAAIMQNMWISILAIILIFILAFAMLWRLIDFANKNPQAAILEGAEFLVHEQIKLAAKGIPEIPQSINSLTIDNPIVINEADSIEANKPDEDNGKEIQNG